MNINPIKLLFALLLPLYSLNLLAQVPENLSSTRSAIVISVPEKISNGFTERGDWKKTSLEAHKSFQKIGIDGIIYLYEDDLNAGPEIKKAYREILSQRNISNIVKLSVSGKGYDLTYELDIYSILSGFNLNSSSYSISAKSMNELMLIIGRQVLRQNIPRTNFLIPDTPEFLDDLVLYTGTRYVNVPSRLKSLGLAVIQFDSLIIPGDISEMDKEKLIAENKEIAKANTELNQIMKAYPFAYDLVSFTSVGELYKKGYQYALMPIISSGTTIKQMLNYKTISGETVYITEVSKKGEKPKLKRLPSNSNMTKYYLKQTIAKDIHVGKRWDADVSWQKSLENFIENVKFDFNIK